MSLLRPPIPFEIIVTFFSLAFEKDFPWACYECGGQLMVSYPVPQIRRYTRSPLATFRSFLCCHRKGVRTFLATPKLESRGGLIVLYALS